MIHGRFDLRTTVRAGLLAGVVAVFTIAVGMVEGLNVRMIVDGVLSLGFLFLFWYIPVAGYRVGAEKLFEGQEASPVGPMHVVAGSLVGAIAGVMMWLLVVVSHFMDLQGVFTRLGTSMVRLLTFGNGLGFGALALIGMSLVLGAIGGALHLVGPHLRRRVVVAAEAVVVVSLVEDVISQVLRTLSLDSWVRTIYFNGALRVVPAIVVAVIAGALASAPGGERKKGLRDLLVTDDPKRRARNSSIAALVGLAVVAVAPWVLGSLLSEVLANVGIFLLMALGLNIVVGFAGLLDLGYVAFFAVGAYTTGILTSPLSPRISPEWPWWWTLPVVVVVAAIAGILVGTPVIRMRGDYLAIVTLGFGEIVRILFLSDWLGPYFGAAQGIRNIPGIPLGFDTIGGPDPQFIMYFAAALVLLSAWVSYALLNSRIGRAWIAMREDESVAEVMGIDTTKAKLSAFIVGAILAALGGALFAAKLGSIFPNSFELLVSIVILVIVIVGGMGNITGVAVGALVLIGVLGGPRQPGLLQELSEFKLLIFGVILIYMMLQRPEGLVPSVRRQRELHQDEYSQDAWFGKGGDTDDVEEPV